MTRLSPVTVVCALIAFISVLGAYVALVLNGIDGTGLVQVVVTLAGLAGVSGHFEKRTQQQNTTISKIEKQTNGVLDERIKRQTTTAVAQLLDERGLTAKPKRRT